MAHLVGQVTAALLSPPLPLVDTAAVAPSRPGVYAWWGRPDLLPVAGGRTLPGRDDLAVLYVGVGADLHARIAGRHLRGSTGSSTLRLTLASLLRIDEGFETRRTSRVVLTPDGESRLTEWMHQHVQVTWRETAAFDDVEPGVIAALAPPLNLDHNAGHPARPAVQAARAAFRASAGLAPTASRAETSTRMPQPGANGGAER